MFRNSSDKYVIVLSNQHVQTLKMPRKTVEVTSDDYIDFCLSIKPSFFAQDFFCYHCFLSFVFDLCHFGLIPASPTFFKASKGRFKTFQSIFALKSILMRFRSNFTSDVKIVNSFQKEKLIKTKRQQSHGKTFPILIFLSPFLGLMNCSWLFKSI